MCNNIKGTEGPGPGSVRLGCSPKHENGARRRRAELAYFGERRRRRVLSRPRTVREEFTTKTMKIVFKLLETEIGNANYSKISRAQCARDLYPKCFSLKQKSK